MPDDTAVRTMPDLFEDDNERIWAKGHEHDDEALRIALAILALRDWNASNEEAFEWAAGAVITRVWFRDAKDPNNDELMVRCEPDDEGAEPFTQVNGGWL